MVRPVHQSPPSAVAPAPGSRRNHIGGAGQLAAALAAADLARGDRVAVMLRNDIEFLEVSLAIATCGANPVPINTRWQALEVAHVLADSGARLIIAQSEFIGIVEDAIALAGVDPRHAAHRHRTAARRLRQDLQAAATGAVSGLNPPSAASVTPAASAAQPRTAERIRRRVPQRSNRTQYPPGEQPDGFFARRAMDRALINR